VLGHPFIGLEGERVGQTGRGIRRPVVGHHYGPSGSVGRGNEGGEWGVKRGECSSISGEEGMLGQHTLEAAMAVFDRLHPREEGSRVGPMRQ
jgi:hypothetical protein